MESYQRVENLLGDVSPDSDAAGRITVHADWEDLVTGGLSEVLPPKTQPIYVHP